MPSFRFNYSFSGIFILGARRTPFGAFGGALSKHSPTDLQEIAAKSALEQAKVDPKQVDSVVIGNVISVSYKHSFESFDPVALTPTGFLTL